MSDIDAAAARVLMLFEELKLSHNDGWLVLLELCASAAAESGMTWEQTRERVEKAFRVYKRAYADRAAAGTA